MSTKRKRISKNAIDETSNGRKITTATPQTIRHVNRRIVLNLIRLHQPLSRAGLSRITGMHRSNISVIVEELIADGLVREERADPMGRGRVPFLLYVTEDSVYVIGVNLWVSETKIALGRLDGSIEKVTSFTTPDDPSVFVQMLDREIRRLLLTVRPSMKNSIRNLTVSVPGHIKSRANKEVWIPALPAYSGFSLGEAIEAKIGIPTEVMNNASLGALTEMWLEEMDHVVLKDFIFLLIGDMGAGSGLVIHHQLYLGHDLTFAGEFGHMVIDPDGPKCACGKHGCWQLYVSASATWKRYRPTVRYTAAGFHQFLQSVRNHDSAAIAALKETAKYIALGVANISQILNPEVIILCGEITAVWDILQPEIVRHLLLLNTTTEIRPTKANANQIFLQGAVRFGLNKIFNPPGMRMTMPQS